MKKMGLTKIFLTLLMIFLLVSSFSISANAQLLDKNENLEIFGNNISTNFENLIIVDDEPGYNPEDIIDNPPEDYTSINDALEASNDNDIIIVYKGKYQENLVINTQITLLGESCDNTIIDGNGTGDVIKIIADHVTIVGFTIRNCGELDDDYNNSGIEIYSDNNLIKGNKICDNPCNGILLNKSMYNNIIGNTITSNYHGVILEYCTNNTISNNKILNSEVGVCLYYSNNTTVIFNDISNNLLALCINHGTSNNVSSNIFSNNDYGLNPYYSCGNTISKNNFLKNKKCNAYFRGKVKNNWEGNYWNRPRILPKIIFGRSGKFGLTLRLDLDKKPAREAYIINP